MTEKAFIYDDKLLESCAHSDLTNYVRRNRSEMNNDDDHDGGSSSSSSGSSSGSGFTIKDTVSHVVVDNKNEKDNACLILFELYSNHYNRPCCSNEDSRFERIQILPSVVELNNSKNQIRFGWKNGTKNSKSGCDDDDDVPAPKGEYLQLHLIEQNHSRDERYYYHYHYRIGSRLERFVRGAHFVHSHNSESLNKDPKVFHRVTINRFTDMETSMIFKHHDAAEAPHGVNADVDVQKAKEDQLQHRRSLNFHVPNNRQHYRHLYQEEEVDNNSTSLFINIKDAAVAVEQSVANVLGIGKGSMNWLKVKSKKKKSNSESNKQSDNIVRIPPFDAPKHEQVPSEGKGRPRNYNRNIDNLKSIDEYHRFEVPFIKNFSPEVDGSLLKVRPKRQEEHNLQIIQNEKHPSRNNKETILVNTDEFAFHLDWATTQNPDGISLVHGVIDQGDCGSCWAYAATGSLEASASRREAYKAYHEYWNIMLRSSSLSSNKKNNPNNYQNQVKDDDLLRQYDTIDRDAVSFAQLVEKAVFNRTDLSIQQLIDCDVTVDQGCTGGNPLLAFYYIHKYGLTTWDKYPYVERKNSKCYKHLTNNPVAKVKSWGVLSRNHENDMQIILRYVGPIAVGINGADFSFLSYEGGIFDSRKCKQETNHALLITGYGQEERIIPAAPVSASKRRHKNYDETNNNNSSSDCREVVKYWIARNSWGKGWGENGYVRIRRGDGFKGTSGICGIAKSPSVALGGYILLHDNNDNNQGGKSRSTANILFPNHPIFIITENQLNSTTTQHQNNPFKSIFSKNGFVGRILQQSSQFVEDHRVLTLGLSGVACTILLAVWPLTLDCRRRRRRMQELKRQEKLIMAEKKLTGARTVGESYSLLYHHNNQNHNQFHHQKQKQKQKQQQQQNFSSNKNYGATMS